MLKAKRASAIFAGTMSPDREREALEAQQLLNNEFLNATLAEIERDAIERAVSAPIADHDLRAAALGEVRAIRSFKSRLNTLISEAASSSRVKGAIA